MSVSITPIELAKKIDHTLLAPTATHTDIQKLIDEAREFEFHSICIHPFFLSFAKEQLQDTDVKLCTVVGFPLGIDFSDVKKIQTQFALSHSADEIDMVANLNYIKEHKWDLLKKDIQAVVESAKGHLVKVILETDLLTDEEILNATEASIQARAYFVKTSTGFLGKGASLHAVSLMSQAARGRIKVKASGGIRNLNDALMMIKQGADRLGVSAGVAIINELKNKD